MDFWKRQFSESRSGPQLVFDVTFGILLPIICLIADPIVFSSGIGGRASLFEYRFFGYTEIGLGVLVLSYFLIFRKTSSWLAGLLVAGALFSLVLGAAIFPLSILGLVIGIGILGLSPFLSALVFARNVIRCQRSFRSTEHRGSAALTTVFCVLALGIPLSLQIAGNHVAHAAMHDVTAGSDEQAARAMPKLRIIRPFVDSDELVFAYRSEDSTERRERLKTAYRAMTGRSIEDRLDELSD